MPLRTVAFIANLNTDTRRRHAHTRLKGEVSSFTIQMEVWVKDKWPPVVRYDTAHGFAHKHLFHYKRKSEQAPMFIHNYNEALDFADSDIKINWELYRERFLKEAGNE